MKKKRSFNQLPLILVFALAAVGGQLQAQTTGSSPAQTAGQASEPFAYRSELDTVRQAGFYKITLVPDLLAKSKEDLSDLRIRDSAGGTVPYVKKSDLPVFTTDNFTPFSIISNEKLKDSFTEVVIANGLPGNISALLLVMKNVSARRSAILSGSDDRGKWFVIREHIELQEAGSDTADHYVQSISFPTSNYRFFKLILEDKGLLPVNILKAGVTGRSFTIGKYLGVPFPALTQYDSSDKHSYILLQYRDRYRIDKLNILLQGPPLFKREARVYDRTGGGNRVVAETTLSPGNTSFLIPATVKTDSLWIDISNEDNKPLVVQAVQTAQLNQYLIAWLQQGSGYSLLTGNVHAQQPEYDLKYFTDSLTKDPQEILSGPLQPVSLRLAPLVPPRADHSGLWLWSILGIVLVLLASLSFNMMKSIPKKEDQP